MRTDTPPTAKALVDEPAAPPRPVAVIDIGTSSIRMKVAQIDAALTAESLEVLSQPVNLGKDTFTDGRIGKATTKQCVRVLRNYRRVLDEYQIVDRKDIRMVATSAVREADNRLAFIDRIYVATGLRVEVIDEPEVNRLTYLSIQPVLRSDPELAAARLLITEIGGGSTELLLVEAERVAYSHNYRLGSLRLRKTLEAHRAPSTSMRRIMENQIKRTADQVGRDISRDGKLEMIAMGGDMRFAADQLLPDWDATPVGRLPLSQLEQFTDRILERSVDELVHEFHLTFPEADTVGPTLLAYCIFARTLRLDRFLIAKNTLRDGLLMEMASRGTWDEAFNRQIIQSAIDLGRKYGFDEAHALHVADLCRKLFHALQDEHQLEPRYELLLYIAALLHDIGHHISERSHHKHSMYLILNSEMFGLGRRDRRLVAMVARYHRRATPRPTHEGYVAIDHEHRIAVSKMAAILRVADALDRSSSQRIDQIECVSEDNRLVIVVPSADDLSLEQLALNQKGTFFEDIFGMKVLLRRAQRGDSP